MTSSHGSGGSSSGTGGGAGGGGHVIDCTTKCPALVTNTTMPAQTIALNGTDIFWADRAAAEPNLGSIWRYPLIGGAEALVVKTATPHSIAVDNENVYWTDNTIYGAVLYAPAAFTSSQGVELQVDMNTDVAELAASATDLFWLEPAAGAVRQRVKAAAGPAAITIGMDASATLKAIYYASPYVFWKGSQGIERMQVDPLGPTVHMTGADQATLAIGSDYFGDLLYWTVSTANGTVHRAPFLSDNQPGELLAANEDYPYHITADLNYIYWVTNGSDCNKQTGAIRRRSRDSKDSTVEILAKDIICATNFAQNSTHVFYGSGNAIYGIPK